LKKKGKDIGTNGKGNHQGWKKKGRKTQFLEPPKNVGREFSSTLNPWNPERDGPPIGAGKPLCSNAQAICTWKGGGVCSSHRGWRFLSIPQPDSRGKKPIPSKRNDLINGREGEGGLSDNGTELIWKTESWSRHKGGKKVRLF